MINYKSLQILIIIRKVTYCNKIITFSSHFFITMSKLTLSIYLILVGLLLFLVSSSLSDLQSCAVKEPKSDYFCITLQSQRKKLISHIGLYGDWSKHVYVKKPNSRDLHQQWLVKPNLDDTVKLQNRNSTRCLCVRGEEHQYWDGYRAHSCPCNNSNPEENWRLVPAGGNKTCVYRLQSNYTQSYVSPALILQRVYAKMRRVEGESRKADWKVLPCQIESKR
jgi:Ricin-type beta-trefoil lectin domain-like